MAAFIDNRGQSENSPVEQQERRMRLRRRQRRTLQKQIFEQEVPPLPSPQPPQRSFGKSILRRLSTVPRSTRPPLEPPRPRIPRPQRIQPSSSIHSSVPPLRPVSAINPQRPSTTAQESTFLPQSNPREFRTQTPGYRREEQGSNLSARVNPWQVQPKTPSPLSPLPRVGSQTPQSLDTHQGAKRREGASLPIRREVRAEGSALSALNVLKNSSKRRREHHPFRTAAPVAAPISEGQASYRRVSVKSGSSTAKNPIKGTAKRSPKPKRPVHPFVYIIRLLILGIGIGAIAGTLLSALHPATQASVKVNNDQAKPQVKDTPSPASPVTPLALTQEILSLKSQIQTLAANNPKLQPGVFIVDINTGTYIDINSRSPVPAASTIKVPILVALFKEVDEGKIRLDESLTLQSEMIATGSGNLQYQKPGAKFTVLELATKMITISDNTATNMLIARLGGIEALNQRFRAWGLTTTVLRNALPDLEGTNTASPQELAALMAMINQGQLVSLPSRDRILSIMQSNEINSLLPQGLGSGAIIAHKTGNIGALLADVGLVNMPSGKSYIISVMVQRPFNDDSAQELIRKISKTAYEYFNQPQVSPSTSSMPSDTTATGNRAVALDQ
ncbi:hydrolase [Allocoleopsis franciscana]|uniref:Beta-lactamase class A n=1 Tax=Allocoleopsis franciscana PCC 7113 TaxID=1173027 RepID=K9WCY8_9CYAN|nr:hydrolase [Allocoleopsis franciscana]AFZ17671.1 beta-lactamase class A [Allocoleopsis franciscana PCC 7113]